MYLEADLNQVVTALSLSLDLAEGKAMEHAYRTAFVALSMARVLGLSEEEQLDICYASLMHDLGAMAAKGGDYHSQQEAIAAHCRQGELLARRLPLGGKVADIIRWHHCPWQGSGGEQEKTGDAVPAGAHLVHLADQFELAVASRVGDLSVRNAWLERMAQEKGRLFAPWAVEALAFCCRTERFWLDYANGQLGESAPLHRHISLGLDQLEEIAGVFGQIIDLKSRFTARHSQGLAELARRLATAIGLDQTRVRLLGVAGMLHDLGKLGVPNEILDKPGQLTPQEFLLIKGHPYYTKKILRQVKGFETLARWAGNHHERLDGSGYPEGLMAADMGLEERLMAIADIYQALTEDRPYRASLSHHEATNLIKSQVEKGTLCQRALEVLAALEPPAVAAGEGKKPPQA